MEPLFTLGYDIRAGRVTRIKGQTDKMLEEQHEFFQSEFPNFAGPSYEQRFD